MRNKNRYKRMIKKMDLQNEEEICAFLKSKEFKGKSSIYPLSSLHFELTTHCNAFCKHCYNVSGKNVEKELMTPKKWIEFSNYIVDKGGVFECILSGGEPLLLKDSLFEIMDVLAADETIFFLITNGYFLSDEVAKRLSRYRYHSLQISIDSATEEYHDSFRNLKGGWRRATEGAKFVTKYGIPLKIAHCVTPYNINGIDEMCKLAFSLGAKSIMVGEVCLSGRVASNKDILLNEYDRKKMIDAIEENRIKFDGKMKIKSSHSVKEGLEKQAQWPEAGVVIRPNGDIRIDGMAPFVIGNILRDDFTEIWKRKIKKCWNDSRVKSFIQQFESDDRNYKYINYVDEDIFLE